MPQWAQYGSFDIHKILTLSWILYPQKKCQSSVKGTKLYTLKKGSFLRQVIDVEAREGITAPSLVCLQGGAITLVPFTDTFKVNFNLLNNECKIWKALFVQTVKTTDGHFMFVSVFFNSLTGPDSAGVKTFTTSHIADPSSNRCSMSPQVSLIVAPEPHSINRYTPKDPTESLQWPT